MIVLALVLGVLTWSLMEYCIHRWLGHDKRFIRNLFGREHTAHHAKGNYFAPAWKKGASALVLTAVLTPPLALVLGWALAGAYIGGLIGFYLTYELVHRLLHEWEGVGPYARWARRHHFHHHFHDPRVNHGVTSPLWDWVFGTLATPEPVIRVPRKLAMRWLIDPGTDELRTHLAGEWALRGTKRAA